MIFPSCFNFKVKCLETIRHFFHLYSMFLYINRPVLFELHYVTIFMNYCP